jgi:hypothetical protein
MTDYLLSYHIVGWCREVYLQTGGGKDSSTEHVEITRSARQPRQLVERKELT